MEKNPILHHMNKDHQRSLSMYLQVYCGVSGRDAQSAQLEDITLDDLLLRVANGTRYTIPLTPPLKSLSEARPRVVAMHKHCLEKLGLSSVVITEYRAPRGMHAVIFAVCLGLMVGFGRRAHFEEGSWVARTMGEEMAQKGWTVQPWVLGGLVGAHVLEALLLAVTRLRRHGVELFSRVWWMWMGSTVIEGFAAFQRIDGMVKEKQKGE
ncbi:putative integral membrane protein [Aspergillus ambiguus]|uniref:DUF2470 domain-containing protein n=1 Tax=Aspergillus ambiguus TaxID=176160 RepID=UPI003CCD2972